ncbi:MAG: T9SS type A sorting domain-containing protein [Chitinophagaceae bacterium]|nr:T9SS type A sorting domain-containing protein [Chitinophagaceae bacterium]
MNLTYFLPEKDVIEINLYDLSGRIIKEVLVDEKERGNYSMQLNLNELIGSTGIYFLEFKTTQATSIRKITFQK